MDIAEPKQWKKPWGELLRLVMLGVEDWEEIIVVNTSKGGLYVQQLPLTKLRLSHPDLERLSELREFRTWRENWPFCRRKDDPIRMLVDEKSSLARTRVFFGSRFESRAQLGTRIARWNFRRNPLSH